MKFLAALYPGGMSFFWGKERSKVVVLSKLFSGCHELLSAAANTLGKITSSAVSVSVSRIVPNILGVRTGSEVLDSVIQGIAVNVIHYMALRNLNPMESQYNSMDHHLVFETEESAIDAHICHSFGGSLVADGSSFLSSPPAMLSTLKGFVPEEVIDGSFKPVQVPGFGIVSKCLLKINKLGQLFSRMHNQVFGYVFRRIQELTTPGAPSFYSLTDVSQPI